MKTPAEPIREFLRPCQGRRVPHPGSSLILAAAGELVIVDGYWYARINDGDVERVSAEQLEAEAKAAEEAARVEAEELAAAEAKAAEEAAQLEALAVAEAQAKAEADEAAKASPANNDEPPPPLPSAKRK